MEVKNTAGTSIQDTLEQVLTSDESYKYIIYDHTKGEIADFITAKETENDFIIELYHVKKMNAAKYNNSVDDIYEVAGQAVKSIVWLKTKSRLLSGGVNGIVGIHRDVMINLEKTLRERESSL